jgi:hypothetical protein
MKKLLILAAIILSASPALASYRTYKYKTDCYLDAQTEYQHDNCTVVETREKNGALRTRNIFSNRFGLTIKSWFDESKGFMTWDSYNKFEYKWEYKAGDINGQRGYSYVMPGFLVHDISWD